MPTSKFENNIKRKLENRTLAPSEMAWQSLSERLGSQTKPNSKKTYWWLGIAASFIIVLVLGSMLFTKTEETPIIVKEFNSTKPLIDSTAQNKIAEEKFEELPTLKNKIQPKTEEYSIHKNSVVKNSRLTNGNTSFETQKAESLTFEEAKIQEVIAQVNNLQAQNTNVTDAEIEALLFEAEQQIKQYNTQQAQIAGATEAELLLQEVEDDLDKTFREKAFEAIKKNVITVKTAIVQRNK